MNPAPEKSTLGLAVILAAMLITAWATWTGVRTVMEAPGRPTSAPGGSRPEQVGRPAPDFSLTDLDGRTVSMADQRGHVVVITFWATWCAPCRNELPHLDQLQKMHRAAGLQVLAVATDASRGAVERFMARHEYSFTVLTGGAEVRSEYGVNAVPSTFLVDREGIVRYLHQGFGPATLRQVRKEVSDLLRERAPRPAGKTGNHGSAGPVPGSVAPSE